MSATNPILRIVMLIVVVTPIFAFAQQAENIYGKIEYATLVEDNPKAFFIDTIEEMVNPSRVESINQRVGAKNSLLKDMIIVLKFNEAAAYSGLNPVSIRRRFDDVHLENDAKLWGEASKRYYTDLSTVQKLAEVTLDFGETFYHIIQPTDQYDWTITDEKKEIQGYSCKKAEGTIKRVVMSGKTISIPVTAWFAPGLPYPYGPMGYDGLPGVVLEINLPESHHRGLRAVSVNVSRDADRVVPTLRKPVAVLTEDEFEEMMAELVRQIRDRN